MLAKAEALFRAGDFDGVRAVCGRVLLGDRDNADAWHCLGAVALQEKRFSEAEESIMRAIGLNRSNPYYRNTLGALRRSQGRFEEAASAYTGTPCASIPACTRLGAELASASAPWAISAVPFHT